MMLSSPILVIITSILTLLQVAPTTARELCFYKQRARSECDANQPYFCCDDLTLGQCCQSPHEDWCGCMDASSLSHLSNRNYDTVMFYQRSDGKSPINNKEYKARVSFDKQTCSPLRHKLNECSIRVVGQDGSQPPPRPGGSNRGVIERKRAPKRPLPNECATANVLHYMLPNGERRTKEMQPKEIPSAIESLQTEDWPAIERLEEEPYQELASYGGSPVSSPEGGMGSEGEGSTLVGSGSDDGRGIGSGGNQ